MKYEQLAKDIIKNVGGKENINSLVHCITRLRFKLKDSSKANTEAFKSMKGVVNVIRSGGQYQVVIGNHVADVYEDILTITGIQEVGQGESDEKEGVLNKFIDTISGVFTPVLGVLVATGMIKGFLALFISMGLLTNTSGTYQILSALGDSLFYFFPIFLGYTAAKKFGVNVFTGMAIGATLVYPTISNLTSSGKPLYTLFQGTAIESPIYLTLFGIPVILMTYSSSVIPIIVSTYIGGKIEKMFKSIIPDVVKTFLVPLCTLLIIVPLAFVIIGPITTWVGKLLGAASLFVYNLSPVIESILVGAFWQVFVIFGVQWGLLPIGFYNMATLGYDPIFSGMLGASFAQIGVVLAIIIKTKSKQLRSLAIPTFISGIFGVTEPAIYGITLPRKKPFVLSCIAAGVGGGIIGFMQTKMYMLGGFGIFAFPSFINPKGIDGGFYGAIIGSVVSFILGFLLMFFAKFKDDDNEEPKLYKSEEIASSLLKEETIISPLKGEVKLLSQIEDETFSDGTLGKGIAIVPSEGKVVAPVDGIITKVSKTKHAIIIRSNSGAEILIHVGMDTVELNGKYFNSKVNQGDIIKAGQLLLEFDMAGIQKEGYLLTTPIIISNTDDYLEIAETNKKAIDYKEELLILKV